MPDAAIATPRLAFADFVAFAKRAARETLLDAAAIRDTVRRGDCKLYVTTLGNAYVVPNDGIPPSFVAMACDFTRETAYSENALAAALLHGVPLIPALEALVLADVGEHEFLNVIDDRLLSIGFDYPGEIPCDCPSGGEYGHHWGCGYINGAGISPRQAKADTLLALTEER